MRLPRYRIRTLLILVALVAVALFGQRVYRDGPEAHWLALKLRYGNVAARRSAAIRALQAEGRDVFHGLMSSVRSGLANSPTLESGRRADILLPALVRAAEDPDAACRAHALKALGFLASRHASESENRAILHQIRKATRDSDDSVRAAAVGALASLAAPDTDAVVNAFLAALADPAVEVREEAAQGLGWLGVMVPATQPDAASVLVPLLAGGEDPRVRIAAARAMALFGVDSRRHPPGAGPDVAPALAAALRDPEVDVRRAAAAILGLTTSDARGRAISAWDRRKDSIVPALDAAISDVDAAVRGDAALALFALGGRDPGVIALIKRAAGDPNRTTNTKFESMLSTWEAEQEATIPVETPAPEGAAP